MRHALTMLTFGEHPTIELAPETYDALKTARKALSAGLEREERYEIVVLSTKAFQSIGSNRITAPREVARRDCSCIP